MWNLHQSYRKRGLRSWVAVRTKDTQDPDVLEIPKDEDQSHIAKAFLGLSHQLRKWEQGYRGAYRLRQFLQWLGEPHRQWDLWRGIEDFHYPGTWRIFDLLPQPPDILHAHNLHRKYFDLCALPWLSRNAPLTITLHDAWLLSGHCAYFLNCERWKTGCGRCPDLTLYPSIRRDATAYNWKRKQRIYTQSRLYVVTPSRWLMQKVEQSMLLPGIKLARVIPNGVDLITFCPGDQAQARNELGISPDAKVLIFSAAGILKNPYKDYLTLNSTIRLLASQWLSGQPLVFLAVGEDAPPEQVGPVEIRFVPYQSNPRDLARYYQAADIYIHAALADNFPTTILEALACGKPVVATSVGGIPEQIQEGYTGFLIPPKDPQAMAERIFQLLQDDSRRLAMSRNAARDAQQRFDLNRQVDNYLDWYQEIAENWSSTL